MRTLLSLIYIALASLGVVVARFVESNTIAAIGGGVLMGVALMLAGIVGEMKHENDE